MLFKSVLYIFLITLAIGLGNLQALWLTDDWIISRYFISYHFLTIFLVSILTIISLNFIVQVNKKFGQGELWAVITGRNFNPKFENRIFMFLDLRISTQYAEQLGHFRYNQFIQRCIFYLNSVVSYYNARLYQYVGDEAVLTWRWDDGLVPRQFIEFYFAFMNLINTRSADFIRDFGLIPEFKERIDGGEAIAAEVVEIKRDIACHGDVINTAARIQAKCNDPGKSLLVSSVILDHLKSIPLGWGKIRKVSFRRRQ